MATTKTTAKGTGASSKTWSDEERAAMREGARERKSSAKMSPAEARAAGEAEVNAKIAAMPDHDRAMATRIQQLVLTVAPDLVPRTYYGMPAWARDGRTICFFKPASKFKERYATFAFDQAANLDDGTMWPKEYALTELDPDAEARITELVRRAVS